MHLVDDDEPDAGGRERLHEVATAETLRRSEQERDPARGDRAEPRLDLVRRQGRVDDRGPLGDRRRQLVDLVLHQRDERREDDGGAGEEHRRELVGQRLARARRHERKGVAPGEGAADDLFLSGPEVVEAEELAQGRLQVCGHPGESRSGAGPLRAEIVTIAPQSPAASTAFVASPSTSTLPWTWASCDERQPDGPVDGVRHDRRPEDEHGGAATAGREGRRRTDGRHGGRDERRRQSRLRRRMPRDERGVHRGAPEARGEREPPCRTGQEAFPCATIAAASASPVANMWA